MLRKLQIISCLTTCLLGLIVTDTPMCAGQELSTEGVNYFETHVRPLLVTHCYECHSADAGEIKGGLSLHNRAGWMSGGESGPAIVPGKPDESLLIDAIRYESYEMPPKGKLTDAQIAVFEQWVKMGAPDPRDGDGPAMPSAAVFDLQQAREFWAFQLPEALRPPQVQNTAWPWQDLDYFVLSVLEQNQLQPASDADRPTWLRRVTYDLIGLPPTIEELTAFLADQSENAREKVVDRLLSSAQFGVHWGRHWLDVARYADSNGSDFNATFYNAWRYRNYVVDCFNQDKPYHQFIREQLAGDLLPFTSEQQRAEQLIATTFLMLGPKMLSERDKDKLTMDVVDEQIDTVGKAFLGMTLGCARCHDHKFDPIPTHDYYALAGIFRSTITLEGESQQYVSTWVETPLPVSADMAQQIEQHKAQREQLAADIAKQKQQLKSAESKLSRTGSGSAGIVVDDKQAVVVGDWKESKYSPAFIGDGYLHDEKTGKGQKSVTWTPQLPHSGQYEVRLSFAGANGRDTAVPVTVQHADGVKQLKVDQSQPAPIENLFVSLGTFRFDAGAKNFVRISTDGTTGYVIADAVQFIPVGDLVAAEQPEKETTETELLKQQIAELTESIKLAEAGLKEFEKTAPQAPKAMAAREAPQIGNVEVCIRGEIAHRGPMIDRGFLQVVSNGPAQIEQKEQSGRRELADWIARADNPLPARVMVNRIWQHMLGEGLVRSVDNFGHLGDAPSHPQLLDTLAVNFVENGWSVKSMIRRIALSRTYAMSPYYDERAFLKDPDNRLLWRANRKRVPAESLRDAILLLSGQLDLKPAESPVAGLGALAIDNTKQDASGRVIEGLKRSLYLPIVRNELPDFLVVFDFADPDMVTGRRPETNVPAQAMYLMNNDFVKQQAKQTAERLLAQQAAAAVTDISPDDVSPDDNAFIELVYRTILNRLPTSSEQRQVADYVRDVCAGDSTRRPQAWAETIQALFASTEFRMLD